MTSVLIGASSVRQLEDNVACVDGPAFTEDELKAVDEITGSAAATAWQGLVVSRTVDRSQGLVAL